MYWVMIITSYIFRNSYCVLQNALGSSIHSFLNSKYYFQFLWVTHNLCLWAEAEFVFHILEHILLIRRYQWLYHKQEKKKKKKATIIVNGSVWWNKRFSAIIWFLKYSQLVAGNSPQFFVGVKEVSLGTGCRKCYSHLNLCFSKTKSNLGCLFYAWNKKHQKTTLYTRLFSDTCTLLYYW